MKGWVLTFSTERNLGWFKFQIGFMVQDSENRILIKLNSQSKPNDQNF